MSAIAAFQKAVDSALLGSAAVAALVGARIYASNTTNDTFPYITHMPIDAPRDDAGCVDGWTVTHQISAWSRQNGGKVEAANILAAVSDALHGARPALDDPYALAGDLVVTMERYQEDPDGLTVQGIIQIRANVERAHG